MVCVPDNSRIKQLRSKDETCRHGSKWLKERFAAKFRPGCISTQCDALQGGLIDAFPLRARPLHGAWTVVRDRAICFNQSASVGGVWGASVRAVLGDTFSTAYCRS